VYLTGIDIRLLDVATSQTFRLTGLPLCCYGRPTWSPDGSRIAFVFDTAGDTSEIDLMDADGGHLRQLTDNVPFNSRPTWSPDGRQIAYVGYAVGDTVSEIFVLDVETLLIQQLTNDATASRFPAWSPDGQAITYFSVINEPSSRGLRLIDLLNGQNRLLVPEPPEGMLSSAVWSPDSQWLVYWRFVNAHAQIYVVNRAGDGMTLWIPAAPCDFNIEPAWSADGRFVVFSCPDGLYRIAADGTGAAARLTDFGAYDAPVLSPDEQSIAVIGSEPGGPENFIYIMDADGGGGRSIIRYFDIRTALAWRP